MNIKFKETNKITHSSAFPFFTREHAVYLNRGHETTRFAITVGMLVALDINDCMIVLLSKHRWARHVARMGRRGMHIGYWWESQKERDPKKTKTYVGGQYYK
jgi:hypothetical protein